MSWFINDGQQQLGPFAEQQVLHMIQLGQLRGGHASFAGGAWAPLEAHPPFAQALGGAAPGSAAAPGGYPAAGPGSGGVFGAAAAGLGGPAGGGQAYAPGPAPQFAPAAQGFQGGPARPGMPMRPLPPRKSSTAGKIVKVVALLAGLGILLVVVAGKPIERYLRRMGHPDKIDAAVTKVSTSKKNKTVTVRIKIKTKEVDSLYISSTAERDGEKKSSYSSGYDAFKETPESSHQMDKKREVKLIFSTGDLAPGKYKAKISVSALYSDAKELEAKFEVPERLRQFATSLSCEGRSCHAAVKGDTIVVKAEAGAKVTVDKTTVTTDGTQEQVVKLDLDAKLAALDPNSLGTAKFPIPVAFAFKDGLALDGKVEVAGTDLRKAVVSKLSGATKGTAVAFPGDDAAPAKARILAKLSSSDMELYGSGTGLKSIDLVATVDYQTRSGSCGSYQNTSTGQIVTVGKTMNDKQVTVYDRRSGRLKSRRLFRAPTPACPTTMSATSSVSSFADSAEVETFLKSMI